MTDENKPDALATKELSMKEIGPALLEKAREQGQEETQKAIISQVQAIMGDVHRKEQMILNLRQSIDHQQSRLKALNAGEFKIEYSFHAGAHVIRYDDASLQVDL